MVTTSGRSRDSARRCVFRGFVVTHPLDRAPPATSVHHNRSIHFVVHSSAGWVTQSLHPPYKTIMTPHQFIAKWQAAELSERSACQQHFLDLCELLDHPKPAEVDPNGKWFTFEKGVDTSDARKGCADVWLDQKFGWEYKGKHKDLRAAYQQLLKYRESLNNPPLLIVCD